MSHAGKQTAVHVASNGKAGHGPVGQPTDALYSADELVDIMNSGLLVYVLHVRDFICLY